MKKTKSPTSFLALACLCSFVVFAAAPFAKNERVVFFGDSITRGGAYLNYLRLWADAEQPGDGVSFVNCGVAGDTAECAVTRFEWDLKPLRPNRVFVMFGMNDVNITLYTTNAPSPEMLGKRRAALEKYERSLRVILRRIRENGWRATLITPTPYDEYSPDLAATRYAGANEIGLAACAEIVRRLAREAKVPLVDLHAPLTKTWRTIGGKGLTRDRVHPVDAGHKLMAEEILRQLGVASPKFDESRETWKRIVAEGKRESDLRTLPQVKMDILRRGGDPDDPAEFERVAGEWLDELTKRKSSYLNYIRGILNVYRKDAPAFSEKGRREAMLGSLLPTPAKVEDLGGWAQPSALVKVAEKTGDVSGVAPIAEEAYVLEVSPTGVAMTASCERGMRYAHVTLDQLKRLARGGAVPCCRIEDGPALKWRGLLFDCGRNYAELPLVHDTIDFLARFKMNVFHWHLSDYHGWRLESKKYPQLQSPGSFTRQTGRYYTQAEFREVVAYAAKRGVTVVPEIDVPGHSAAFRRAFGLAKMNSPGVDKIVCDLIDELCSLAPKETMPTIHLGTDEVRKAEEQVPDSWYASWARRVTANGRTVMGWWPGHALETNGPKIQQTWYETRPPSGPYVDATCYYVDSFDPAGLLAQATFKRPCPYPVDPAFRLGGEIQAWHDDPIETSGDLVRDNPVFPAIALFSDSYWRDRPTNRTDLIFRPPSPDRPEFARLADLERRVKAQRDRTLDGFNHPFHFVAQTHMRWRLEDESGRSIAKDVPSGVVYAHSPRGEWGYPGFVDSPTGTVILTAKFDAPADLEAGAIVELSAFHRSGARKYGLPARGEWNRYGATVTFNGEKLAPPEWRFAKGDEAKLADFPWSDESGWIRPHTPIRIRCGENEVRIVLPKTNPTWYWSATFIPVKGTRERPREIPGLVFR